MFIKEIYLEGFRNLGSFIQKNYMKVLAWFSFFLILISLYALIFRISTGFAFD
ncbi:DUF6747 family protein [Aurantibacter crassamenti]|uniref:DUF6747 family protein n=1 Tax=Aurantibacter crassamenti TaxID=1837375 RepID=UPI00293D9EBE|nr:DUF6747 family protein [Aurantibacter crassamenti]